MGGLGRVFGSWPGRGSALRNWQLWYGVKPPCGIGNPVCGNAAVEGVLSVRLGPPGADGKVAYKET